MDALENQLKEARFLAEEADKKYDEVQLKTNLSSIKLSNNNNNSNSNNININTISITISVNQSYVMPALLVAPTTITHPELLHLLLLVKRLPPCPPQATNTTIIPITTPDLVPLSSVYRN